MLTIGHRLLNGTLVAALLLAAAPAFVQQASAGEGIGVVTAIQGQATVSRVALPQPAALRFKDDVFFRDQIATREHSTVRLLLGGKGSFTVREQSQVTLDESVTPDGGRRSVIGLLAGKIGAAIAHALMRPGESVEIHTPNAVAAVRGTVLIAEYIPPQGSAAASQPILLASAARGPFLAQAAGAGGTSNFFVLSGQVTITPQGQPPLTLGPLQAVSVTATPGGVQAGAVQNITPAQAAQAAQGLETGKPHTGEAEGSKTAQAQAEVAAAITNVILQATTGQPTTNITAPNPPNNTVAPVVPSVVTQLTVALAPGTSLMTFTSGDTTRDLPSGPLLSLGANPPASSGGVAVSGSGTVLVTSPLVAEVGNPITHSGAMLTSDSSSIVGDSSETKTPLVSIEGTSVTNTGGPALEFTNSTLDLGSRPLVKLLGGSTFETDAGPIIRVSGGSLTADALGTTDGAENTWNLTGTILDLTDTTVHLRVMGTEPSGSTDTFSHTLAAGEPAIRMTNSNLTLTGAGEPLWHFDADSDGVALIATNTSGTQKTISLAGPLLDLDANSSSIDLSSTDPLAALSEMTVQQTGTDGLIQVRNGIITVHAPLLQMTNTGPTGLNTVAGSLLKILSQGDLEGSDISDPLIKITGGTHAIGSATVSGSGSILDIIGVNNGEGLCQALSWGGTILRAENATIDLSGSGNVIRVDTAKVDTATADATKPIINLINSTLNTSTSGDSTTGAIYLYQSHVTSNGPVFGLDTSTLTVRNGPALSVTNGATVSVNSDFATLINGSKITVQNGPLIYVDGSLSSLTVTGALVNFGGTSGNQLIINNSSISPTTTVNGVPVYKDTNPSTSILIPGNPIKNSSLGTATVNGVSFPGSGPYTGSVIKATNGGYVRIGPLPN